MSRHPLIRFSKPNRRLILLLLASHLLWGGAILGLWAAGSLLESSSLWLSGGFIALQLYTAAQALLPVLLLSPETRNRCFYLFWGGVLALSIWLLNQLTPVGIWLALLTAMKSALLLLFATLIGTVLARYVQRLWELVPICIVMTLADFMSWAFGPTASFTAQIQAYYLAPVGPPPLIDMLLIKLVFSGYGGLMPVFGISDWIMVVFFAIVASRFSINDNLLGRTGKELARQGALGRYLPVSLVALFGALQMAQLTGHFIPALPLIALSMLLWYAARYLLLRLRT